MSLRNDYEERKNDVKAYVMLIEQIDTQKFSQTSRRILRANVFILLYNLIESTIANCGRELDSEFVTVTTAQIHDLTEPIVNYWIRFTLFSNPTKKGKIRFSDQLRQERVKTLTEKFLTPTLPLELEFNFGGEGNLDNDEIKKIFGKYGIETALPKKLHQEVCRHRFNSGKGVLQFIKDTRNALAHGEKSFTEFGDYSTQEINDFAVIVFEYLEFMIGIIEDFVKNKKYLKRKVGSDTVS